jgi:hypothetical protein
MIKTSLGVNSAAFRQYLELSAFMEKKDCVFIQRLFWALLKKEELRQEDRKALGLYLSISCNNKTKMLVHKQKFLIINKRTSFFTFRINFSLKSLSGKEKNKKALISRK